MEYTYIEERKRQKLTEVEEKSILEINETKTTENHNPTIWWFEKDENTDKHLDLLTKRTLKLLKSGMKEGTSEMILQKSK